MSEAPLVLGKPEIAVLLQVDRGTPAQWIRRRKRSQFPEPDHPSVNGLDAWHLETIEAWAERTNRMPEKRQDSC